MKNLERSKFCVDARPKVIIEALAETLTLNAAPATIEVNVLKMHRSGDRGYEMRLGAGKAAATFACAISFLFIRKLRLQHWR